jgi:SAM-dependent methyltransferase
VLETGPGHRGQGLRLARAGHRVTVLEPDPAVLPLLCETLAAEPRAVRDRLRIVDGDGRDTGAHFLPGAFEVVVCHGSLMAARDPGASLAGLARMLAPGGVLSLLVRNDAALAMHPARGGDWGAALAAFDFPERAFRLETLTPVMARLGAPVHAWYGVEVFGTAADAPADEQRLAAEERAGRTDPYRAVAALLHVCGRRAAAVGR